MRPNKKIPASSRSGKEKIDERNLLAGLPVGFVYFRGQNKVVVVKPFNRMRVECKINESVVMYVKIRMVSFYLCEFADFDEKIHQFLEILKRKIFLQRINGLPINGDLLHAPRWHLFKKGLVLFRCKRGSSSLAGYALFFREFHAIPIIPERKTHRHIQTMGSGEGQSEGAV